MHARTHARTHARRRMIAVQVQRVHHAYIDDDVRGICTWRYMYTRAGNHTVYIRCHEEGESDSSPLESAYTDGRMQNPADDGKYPRQRTGYISLRERQRQIIIVVGLRHHRRYHDKSKVKCMHPTCIRAFIKLTL